ncbi:MAG: hypothetical protein Q9220_000121 [cf. Caloplaca sp. 1 TL-2023]
MKTEEYDSIFVIFAGLSGRYDDIKIAFELVERAIEWCRDQLQVVSTKAAFTEFPKDGVYEVVLWLPDQQGRIGYTVVEKSLTLVGWLHLPNDGSQVHAVCDEKTLEVSYIGTDLEKASDTCNRIEGAIVRSIDIHTGGSRIIPSVFTYGGSQIDPSRLA